MDKRQDETMKTRKKRRLNIDIIKAFAIVSVILLHTFDGNLLLEIGAPFHIWQAVPIFMILQGFNNGGSYKRREYKVINDFTDQEFIVNKTQRLLFPFIVFFIIQTVFLYLDTPNYFASENHLLRLFTGGRGPGSYFVPLTIQAQLIVPLMFLAARKSVSKMLIGSFFINVLLEVYSLTSNMNEELYRILIIRFIFALALGVALSMWGFDKFKTKSFYIASIVSLIYIVGVMYFNWNFIMEKYWHSQHIPGFIYPLFLIIFINGLEMNDENKIMQYAAEIGKASYHIFFTQLLYFWKPIQDLHLNFNPVIGVLFNIFVPLGLGLLFYRLEQKMWLKLNR